jgi:hypothetical protein
MHLVPATGQWESVHASSATDIKYTGWRWRQVALDDLPRPDPFKATDRCRQSLLFVSLTVVLEDFGSNHGDRLTESA